MKTLRTYLAEKVDDYGPQVEEWSRPAVVDDAVAAVRSWLAQPEIMVIISNGLSETESVGGAALALRREAVK